MPPWSVGRPGLSPFSGILIVRAGKRRGRLPGSGRAPAWPGGRFRRACLDLARPETRGAGRRGEEPSTPMESAETRTNVVILGSTGSVGRSALSVIEHDAGARLKVGGLGAHSSWEPLVEQARAFRPRYIALTDPRAAACINGQLRGTGVEVLSGPEGLVTMVQDPATDRVLSAIVG